MLSLLVTSGSRFEPYKRAFSILLLIFIFAGGTFLRMYHLSAQPYWMDEGYTINGVLSVLEHGSTVLDSGQNYSCALYCYPDALLTHVFGANAFAYRSLAALTGIIFTVAIYFMVADFSTPLMGLAVSFFTAFSYWQIAWSRQARWYTLFELFLWLSLYFFYKALHGTRAKLWYAALAAGATILAILTTGLGWVLPVLFLVWLFLDLLMRKKVSQKNIVVLAVAFIVAAAALWLAGSLPSFLSLARGIRLGYELPYYLNFYLRTYWLFVPFAVFVLFDTPARYKKLTWFLLAAFLAYLLPLSFLTDVVQYRYLFALTPAILILGTLGIARVASHLKKDWQKVVLWAVVVFLFFGAAGGVWKPATYYFLEADDPSTLGPRPHYAYTPQPDWNGAYAYIAQHQTAGDIVVSSMPQFNKIFLGEPGYWIEYSYLGFASGNPKVVNGKEAYVNAEVIDGLAQLQSLTAGKHGYIVFDYLAVQRLPQDLLQFVQSNFTEVFYENTNAYSQVWVYRF